MYEILMPIDDSEARAKAQAGMVTKLPHVGEGVHVTVVHVSDDQETAMKTDIGDFSAGALVYEALTDAGIAVEFLSRSGDPPAEILQAADERNADLILLGGRKRSSLGSLLFGSVTQEVILDATRPVTVTGGVEETDEPTHRCQSCGEEYHTDRSTEIATCRNCGGAKVETLN